MVFAASRAVRAVSRRPVAVVTAAVASSFARLAAASARGTASVARDTSCWAASRSAALTEVSPFARLSLAVARDCSAATAAFTALRRALRSSSVGPSLW